MRINDSIFLGAIVPELDNGALVIQQNKRILFLSLLSRLIEVVVRGVPPLALPDAVADSLAYLKAFGGTEQRNLPDGYTQLEYIESDGTQYIDTGIVPTKNTKIEIHNIQKVSDTAFGVATQIYVFNVGDVNYYNFGAGPNAGSYTGTNLVNLDATIVMSKDDGLVINGQQVVAFSDVSDFTTDLTFWLFARNNTTTNYKMGAQRTYYFKMWNNGTLVRNLIPAKRNSDNVVGMYDTVSGTFFTNAGTGTFTAGANVTTPTPDTPMDIISNNGVLKVRRQSGLPDGYTQLEYIESDGTQYIDTGVVPKTTLSAKIKYNILQLTEQNNIAMFGSLSNQTGFFSGLAGYPPMYYINNSSSAGAVSDIPTALNTIIEEEYINDTMIRDGVTYATNPIVENNISMTLFGRNTGAEVLRIGSLRIYYFALYDNGVLVRNFVPAKRNSDNVVGMYDTVSQAFFTNAGTGTFTAGNPVNDLEIYADGTVETINVHSKNLFDKTTITANNYINASGAVTSDGTNRTVVSDKIYVKPSTTYTLSGVGNLYGETYYRSGFQYQADNTPISAITYTESSGKVTFTTAVNCAYVRVMSLIGSVDTAMLEQGSTATDYVPYYDGGTATAEMLLKVGDYEDVQKILSGAITRNVGGKVLDGTENWVKASGVPTRFYLELPNGSYNVSEQFTPYCTHCQGCLSDNGSQSTVGGVTDGVGFWYNDSSYKYYELYLRLGSVSSITDATTLKQYLADQYAAGTPVIVIYPLATPTTESVAGQAMQVQQGDNIVEITQASLSNLELEAKYQAAVSLTIQEVQDANLDPNVQVTIN